MSSGVQSALIFLVFSILYLGQALLARFVLQLTWIGKALAVANQWFSVVCVSALFGAAAAFVKMRYFSKGHFGTSISGLAWSGDPAHEGLVFGITFAGCLVVAGYFLARSARPSVVADVALFFVPVACTLGGAIALALLITER